MQKIRVPGGNSRALRGRIEKRSSDFSRRRRKQLVRNINDSDISFVVDEGEKEKEEEKGEKEGKKREERREGGRRTVEPAISTAVGARSLNIKPIEPEICGT